MVIAVPVARAVAKEACGLRWHPHERHSLISPRNALGKRLRSVANLTRKDGEELAPKNPRRWSLSLTAANEALDALRSGKMQRSCCC